MRSRPFPRGKRGPDSRRDCIDAASVRSERHTWLIFGELLEKGPRRAEIPRLKTLSEARVRGRENGTPLSPPRAVGLEEAREARRPPELKRHFAPASRKADRVPELLLSLCLRVNIHSNQKLAFETMDFRSEECLSLLLAQRGEYFKSLVRPSRDPVCLGEQAGT
jgi:hypothetical protein